MVVVCNVSWLCWVLLSKTKNGKVTLRGAFDPAPQCENVPYQVTNALQNSSCILTFRDLMDSATKLVS